METASQRWPTLAVVFGIFPAAVAYSLYLYAPCDDAFIFLVYVKNFLAGNGLTYNGAVVEGFTSPLWIATLTAFGITGAPLLHLAEAASLASGLFTLLATHALGRRVGLDPVRALIPVALLAASGDFAFYMSSGLETVLFTGLVALAVEEAHRGSPEAALRSLRLPVVLALCTLARPEGALVALLLLALLAWRSGRVGLASRCGAVFLLLLTPVEIARFGYYGYWLPNTYYVKANAGLANLGWGLEYLGNALPRYAAVVGVLGVLAFASALRGRRTELGIAAPLLAGTGIWIGMVAGLGGDSFVGGRVLVPILPLAYVAATILAAPLSRAGVLAGAAAVAALSLALHVTDAELARHANRWRKSAEQRATAGAWLKQHLSPDSLVALNAAGIIPFHSERPTLDMLGVNDAHIAHFGVRDRSLKYGHQAGDGAYVLSREPDLIFFGTVAKKHAGGLVSDREIAAHPDFAAHYERIFIAGVGHAWKRHASKAFVKEASTGVAKAQPDSGVHHPAPESPTKREVDDDGRWRRFHTRQLAREVDPNLSEEQRQMMAELEAIGYVSGSAPAREERGIAVHDEGRAYPGLNLYTSGHAAGAILMDMDGNEIHRWTYAYGDVWPDAPRPKKSQTGFWRRAHLFPNGDVLAIFEGLGIIKVDRDSNLLWSNFNGAHHDLAVLPDGDILVLTRSAHMVPRIREKAPILEDFISILEPGGAEKRRVSLVEAFENSKYRDMALGAPDATGDAWLAKKAKQGDIFHTNTVELLDGRIADRVPAFEKGNVLISLRTVSVIAVVDLEREKVVWALQGAFKRQHDPKIVDSGNLLLFDNLGRPLQSTIIELDPATGRTAWEYRGTTASPFFSESCGTSERLPNGNTLVSESDNGRAFEVTPEGEIVWEFFNPFRAGDDGEFIATLFEVVRLPADFPVGWAQTPPTR